MSEKYKEICKYLNYPEQLFILASTITGSVSISGFSSIVCFLRHCKFCSRNKITITAAIKKYKSIIKKKKKNHDKIVFLGKDNLSTIEVLVSKALVDSYIIHDKFVSVNNILREYNEIKEEIKNPETSVEYII